MPRRWVALGLAGLAVALAVYSAFWWIVAGRFPAVVDAWAAERRATGWLVDYRIGPVHGFPFSLRSEIGGARLAGPGSPAAWTWRAPMILVRARPWRLTHFGFESPGRHDVTMVANGAEWRIEAVAAAAGGAIVFGTAPWPEVDLAVADLTLTSTARPRPTTVRSIAARLAPNAAPNRPPADPQAASPRLVATVLDVLLPEEPPPVLGRAVERIDLDATWVGRLPPGPLGPALVVWRDGGGTIEVARLGLKWGKLEIEGAGTFALDSELRPIASSNVRLNGYGQALDDLARAGVVRGRDAIAARLMLGLMARSGRTGRDEVAVPITVQDGWFAVGPARLLRVPPLNVE